MGKLTSPKALLTQVLPQAGVDVVRLRRTMRGLPRFVRDYRAYKAAGGDAPLESLWPVIGEWEEGAGGFDSHYLHQDYWAARKLYESMPEHHYDIGSRVDGFIASALVFCDVTMLDVRPMANPLERLRFQQADASSLPFTDACVESISSLHAIEHFGLGRYGDPLNPQGSRQALAELDRVVARGGRLLLGLPVGRPQVMFNAQRIMSPAAVLEMLPSLELRTFSAVDDEGCFIRHAEPKDFESATYACGLFELVRP